MRYGSGLDDNIDALVCTLVVKRSWSHKKTIAATSTCAMCSLRLTLHSLLSLLFLYFAFTLSPTTQKDLLNLLTIWFRHGVIPEVHEVLSHEEEGIASVNLDYWLGVVPQLIACMNHQNMLCKQTLHNLLMRLGKKHPQVIFVLIFDFCLLLLGVEYLSSRIDVFTSNPRYILFQFL